MEKWYLSCGVNHGIDTHIPSSQTPYSYRLVVGDRLGEENERRDERSIGLLVGIGMTSMHESQ